MSLADELRSLAAKVEALEAKPDAKPTQDGPAPGSLALWLQPAPGADPEALRRRNENLARWQSEFDAATFDGPFPVWEMTLADMVYLAKMAGPYRDKTGKDIMRDGLVAGKNADLNRAYNVGELNLRNVDLSAYAGPLKDEVEKRLA